jgi:hypothetical protein
MSTKPHLNIGFNASFRINQANPPTIEEGLAALFQFREHLRGRSPKLSRWYLSGNTKEEAFLHEAFDEAGPTPALLAMLKEQTRQKGRSAISYGTGLWNGEDPPDVASMFLYVSLIESPSLFRFTSRSADFLSHENVLAATVKIAELWMPQYVSVKPSFYVPVFKNRPSAGWMLYLPRELSVQQVPEAQALVPVMRTDVRGKAQRMGTVIVTIGDGPLSEENPEHVKRAHDIEIRLAGQDLLPRFGDSGPSTQPPGLPAR